jgi:hypothetical protein
MLLTLVAGAALSQEQARLDLTKTPVKDLPVSAGHISGGASSVGDGDLSSKGRHGSLSIEILSPEIMTGVRVGGEFIWEVRIQNIGDKAFDLPWDPSLADFQPKEISQSSNFSALSLSLSFVTGKGQTFGLRGTASLYGAQNVKGSFISLRPGESIRVRGKSTALPSAVSENWSTLQKGESPTTVNLQARISFSSNSLTEKSGNYVEDIDAFNSTPVMSQPIKLTLLSTSAERR